MTNEFKHNNKGILAKFWWW